MELTSLPLQATPHLGCIDVQAEDPIEEAFRMTRLGGFFDTELRRPMLVLGQEVPRPKSTSTDLSANSELPSSHHKELVHEPICKTKVDCFDAVCTTTDSLPEVSMVDTRQTTASSSASDDSGTAALYSSLSVHNDKFSIAPELVPGAGNVVCFPSRVREAHNVSSHSAAAESGSLHQAKTNRRRQQPINHAESGSLRQAKTNRRRQQPINHVLRIPDNPSEGSTEVDSAQSIAPEEDQSARTSVTKAQSYNFCSYKAPSVNGKNGCTGKVPLPTATNKPPQGLCGFTKETQREKMQKMRNRQATASAVRAKGPPSNEAAIRFRV